MKKIRWIFSLMLLSLTIVCGEQGNLVRGAANADSFQQDLAQLNSGLPPTGGTPARFSSDITSATAPLLKTDDSVSQGGFGDADKLEELGYSKIDPSKINWPSDGMYADATKDVQPGAITGDGTGTDEINANGGKTVYVRNVLQFLLAVYGTKNTGPANIVDVNEGTGSDKFTSYSDVKRIIIVNDLDFVSSDVFKDNPLLNKYNFVNSYLSGVTDVLGDGSGGGTGNFTVLADRPGDSSDNHNLTIVGNHGPDQSTPKINAGNYSLRFARNTSTQTDNVTLDNLKLYGSTYYGFVRLGIGAASVSNEFYRDVTYYGSQFLWTASGTSNVYISGHTTAYSLYYYKSPVDQRVYTCQGWGTQQVMQVSNVTFEPDAVFNGSTYNGNVLELKDNATLLSDADKKQGAEVNLYPRGSGEDAPNGSSGLYLMNTGVLTLNPNTHLNIDVKNDSMKDSMAQLSGDTSAYDTTHNYKDPISSTTTANAIYMKGTGSKITYNSGDYQKGLDEAINVTSEGADTNPLVYFDSGTAELNRGDFNITANDLGSASNSGLFTLGASTVIVRKGGNFNIKTSDTPGQSSSGNVQLLNIKGKTDISLYKPKNVDLNLGTNTNASSNIVSTSAATDIKAYDIKMRASGTNSQSKVSFGFDDSPTNDQKPVQMQHLSIPFTGNYIDLTKFVLKTPPEDLTGSQAEIGRLLNYLNQMQTSAGSGNSKEFSHIHFSEIDGPVEHVSTPIIDPRSRTVSGSLNKSEDDFHPDPPMLKVVVNDGGEDYDLGTVQNLDASADKQDTQGYIVSKFTPSGGSYNPNFSPSTPDILNDDDDIAYSTDSTDPTTPKTTWDLGKQVQDFPLYLSEDQGIAWKVDTNNIPHFSFDIDKAVDNYNTKNEGKDGFTKLTLKPNDTVKVSAVSNNQESATKTVDINSLYLGFDQEAAAKSNVYQGPKVLLGDKVSVPLEYQDDISSSNIIHLKGYDKKGSTTSLNTTTDTNILQTADVTPPAVTPPDVPTLTKHTWDVDHVTQTPGDHTLYIQGSDDQKGLSPYVKPDAAGNLVTSDLLQYNYHVENVPAFNGYKELYQQNDLTKPLDTTAKGEHQSYLASGNYLEKDLYQPKMSTVGLNDFCLTEPADDGGGIKKGTAKLILHIPNQGDQTLTDFAYGQHYTPGNFKLTGTSFPAGTSFEVDTPVTYQKSKADTQLTLHGSTLQTTDPEAPDQQLNLGASGSLTYNNLYDVSLAVPKNIDYGRHTRNSVKTTDQYCPVDTSDSYKEKDYQLTYEQPANSTFHYTVDVRCNSNNALFNLIYQDGTTDSVAKVINSDVPVFQTGTGPSATASFAKDWWLKTGAKKGIYLQPTQDKPAAKKYQSMLTWTVNNALNN